MYVWVLLVSSVCERYCVRLLNVRGAVCEGVVYERCYM